MINIHEIYNIQRDNCESNRFHVQFTDRREENDKGFGIVVNEEIIEIVMPEGGEVIEFDEMAPFPLERMYTDDKHQRAYREIGGDIAHVLIGGWHDLTAFGAGNDNPNTDCEVLFKFYENMFKVKRTKRDGNITYHFKDINYHHMIRFIYNAH